MIKWSLRKTPDGYQGMVVMVPQLAIPGGFKQGKPIKLVASSRTKAGALAKAASVADKVMTNPLLRDALPPGSSTALAAVKYLSKSAAAGKLENAAKKVVGKGAKRLYKTLSSLW